jgi:hypothetical protein
MHHFYHPEFGLYIRNKSPFGQGWLWMPDRIWGMLPRRLEWGSSLGSAPHFLKPWAKWILSWKFLQIASTSSILGQWRLKWFLDHSPSIVDHRKNHMTGECKLFWTPYSYIASGFPINFPFTQDSPDLMMLFSAIPHSKELSKKFSPIWTPKMIRFNILKPWLLGSSCFGVSLADYRSPSTTSCGFSFSPSAATHPARHPDQAVRGLQTLKWQRGLQIAGATPETINHQHGDICIGKIWEHIGTYGKLLGEW